VDANAYASAADAYAYQDGHLYATDWTGATTQTNECALVMATLVMATLVMATLVMATRVMATRVMATRVIDSLVCVSWVGGSFADTARALRHGAASAGAVALLYFGWPKIGACAVIPGVGMIVLSMILPENE